MDLFYLLSHIGFFTIHGSIYLLHVILLGLYRALVSFPFRIVARLLGVCAEEDRNGGFVSKSTSREGHIYALTSRENRWIMDWFGLNGLESGLTPNEASRGDRKINGEGKIGSGSNSDLVEMYIPNHGTAPYNGHLHTILGAYHPFPSMPTSREVEKSYDLNRICLDFIYPTRKALEGGLLGRDNHGLGRATRDVRLPPPRALVVLLPGITGGSQEVYVRRLVAALLRRNLAVCVLNPRGVAGTPLDVPQFYSALFTGDLRHVLAGTLQETAVRARLGHARRVPILGLGFSLGGAILANYVCTRGPGLDGAWCVCAPHDCVTADAAMRRLFARLTYNPVLTSRLVKYTGRHAEVMRKGRGIDPARLFDGPRPLLRRLRTLRDFDDVVTAPHLGFPDAETYYRAASTLARIGESQTPMMCVVAADDPMCGAPAPREVWANLAREHSKGLVYVEFPAGGHLGFVGDPLRVLREEASPMEILVATSIACFAEHCERKWSSEEEPNAEEDDEEEKGKHTPDGQMPISAVRPPTENKNL